MLIGNKKNLNDVCKTHMFHAGCTDFFQRAVIMCLSIKNSSLMLLYVDLPLNVAVKASCPWFNLFLFCFKQTSKQLYP